jgi:hypothetical protein
MVDMKAAVIDVLKWSYARADQVRDCPDDAECHQKAD